MKRILFAFLITLLGIGLSWHFLRPEEWRTNTGKNRKVVAKVLEIRNDVNRQEDGRLLWSQVRKGDEIFLGDKIKTAGLSSTTIQFVESASKLEIEENSMIVMADGGKKLALNMLEGRVFIKQEEGASDQNLDLLSGGKKLDLKGNTAISVSSDGGSQVESFSQNIFQDLKPNYSEDILSSKNEQILAWKPSGRSESVEVLVGESPLLLKKAEGMSSAFSSGKIEVMMRPGVNYWQLVTRLGDKEVRSPLMKLNLLRPLPPTPLSPADKEYIRATDRPFDFKWIRGNSGDTVVVEVARDASFQKPLFSQEIKDQTFFTPSSVMTEGEYFWRVKSRTSRAEWIESKVYSFTVHQGSNLLSPAPIFPADNSVVYLTRNMANNMKFEWKRQENIRSYELRIRGDNFSRDTNVAESNAIVNINAPGKYTWEIVSQTNDGKQSILPVKRKFEVRESGVIQWNMAQRTFLYLDSLPIVILRWEKRSAGISLLKISTNPDLRDAETFQVQGRDFPYRVMRDGIYFAKVSGLDETGTVGSESDILEFKVQEAPLPAAPVVVGQAKKLKASAQGDLRAQIENGKPSWLTIGTIVDGSGRTVDERRFSEDRLSFSGLMPGKYFLQLKFQDEYKRTGEPSERIELEVPDKSLIAAPKIKGIKVR